jgi:hypothetical protein
MSNLTNIEGNALILNGDHPNVNARLVETGRKMVHVTVSPVTSELKRLIGAGTDDPTTTFYEGPVVGQRMRIKLVERGSTVGGGANVMRFELKANPKWLK